MAKKEGTEKAGTKANLYLLAIVAIVAVVGVVVLVLNAGGGAVVSVGEETLAGQAIRGAKPLTKEAVFEALGECDTGPGLELDKGEILSFPESCHEICDRDAKRCVAAGVDIELDKYTSYMYLPVSCGDYNIVDEIARQLKDPESYAGFLICTCC